MNGTGRGRSDKHLSRRSFLGAGIALAGGSLMRSGWEQTPQLRLTVPRGRPRSRVVQMRSRWAIDGPTVHRTIVREMLEEALITLTETADPRQAWRCFLKPDDVIGIKFNRSGQAVIGTTGAIAEVLIASLTDAGWRPDQLICIEAPPETAAVYGTTPPCPGYATTASDFDSGSDQLALALGQVTALIDVPFLKTHNIAGMTCALKNLSHAFVKHPARYHRNGCCPYVADIVSLSELHGKLRLCLVDGLRVVYDRGPEASAETMSDEGLLMASFDPVATDAVGLAVLNDVRRRHGLPPVADSPAALGYLADAHRKGLGIALAHGIDLVRRDWPHGRGCAREPTSTLARHLKDGLAVQGLSI